MLELRTTTRSLLLIAVLILAAWLIVRVWPVLLLVLISVLLMMALRPAVEALVRWKMPRALAVVSLVLVLLGGVAVLLALLVPSLIDEFKQVNENLPNYAGKVEELLGGWGIEVHLRERVQNVDWRDIASRQAGVAYGRQAITLLFAVISVVVMTAYMLVEAPRIGRFLNQFVESGRKREASDVFEAMSSAVGGYFRGQLITSTAIAVFTFALLRILGVQNAVAFAVLAAIADAVPLVGVFAAILPPVAAALEQSSSTALIVFAALMVYQQFEDRLLVPLVYGRTLRLSPLVVFVSLLLGAQLLGIIGVLLALPMAAIGRVILDFWTEHKRLPLTRATADGELSADDAVMHDDNHRGLQLVLRGLRLRVEPVGKTNADVS